MNDREAKNLKEIMDTEKLNWRSFVYQEAVNSKWNPSTPTYYVIDPQGVIRYKWRGNPGERAMDTAVDKLLEETEGSRKSR